MHTINFDSEKNRLYITLEGVIDLPESAQIEIKVSEALKMLQQGFDVITDISNCKFGYLKGTYILLRIMKKLKDHEVNQVIRVMGDSKIALRQIMAASKPFTGYNPVYVKTRAAAERHLEEESASDSQNLRKMVG